MVKEKCFQLATILRSWWVYTYRYHHDNILCILVHSCKLINNWCLNFPLKILLYLETYFLFADHQGRYRVSQPGVLHLHSTHAWNYAVPCTSHCCGARFGSCCWLPTGSNLWHCYMHREQLILNTWVIVNEVYL